MEADIISEGVEVVVLGDEDFREMFSGPVEKEEENIEHCMSRVSLQDHDYHQPRDTLEVRLNLLYYQITHLRIRVSYFPIRPLAMSVRWPMMLQRKQKIIHWW